MPDSIQSRTRPTHRSCGPAAAASPRRYVAAIAACVVLFLSFLSIDPSHAQAPTRSAYTRSAPLEQYRTSSQAEEIAMARSAAPASISSEAEILTLGEHGYETAVRGKNAFVCLVQRSWFSNLDDPEFWNPKERSPICFNPASARSVLPAYLQRTKWALAGVSKADVVDRTKAALAAKEIVAPEPGAMGYMMSKDGYLSDSAGGHWHPHLMVFLPSMVTAEWGANLPGGVVMGDQASLEPLTVFFVLVPRWSDGTPDQTGE
jgi:hypothetical protein